ncbi:hypothetical protein IQ07DRAFT_232118 [Pyrenochaeta sp. DS3sAY3a]|nr:hypothetical protein IQ07DRAFT_232118 [Pyrenochaeta sp. DS3sAY3a]
MDGGGLLLRRTARGSRGARRAEQSRLCRRIVSISSVSGVMIVCIRTANRITTGFLATVLTYLGLWRAQEVFGPQFAKQVAPLNVVLICRYAECTSLKRVYQKSITIELCTKFHGKYNLLSKSMGLRRKGCKMVISIGPKQDVGGPRGVVKECRPSQWAPRGWSIVTRFCIAR